MVIDPSVVVGILRKEPDAENLSMRMRHADHRWMSTASLLEASIVLDQRIEAAPDDAADALSDLLRRTRIDLVAFTEDHARVARIAYRRYGKGRHKASLNFGDCISYALAKCLDEPLLFKGADFSLTDIRIA